MYRKERAAHPRSIKWMSCAKSLAKDVLGKVDSNGYDSHDLPFQVS